jgi:hypothetical protein
VHFSPFFLLSSGINKHYWRPCALNYCLLNCRKWNLSSLVSRKPESGACTIEFGANDFPPLPVCGLSNAPVASRHVWRLKEYLLIPNFMWHLPKCVCVYIHGLRNDTVSTSEERAAFGERLLPFGPESFVFPLAVWNRKDYSIQNYNFALCFVWVWNLIYHIKVSSYG